MTETAWAFGGALGTGWHSLEQEGSWQGEATSRRKNGELYTSWETLDAARDEAGEVTSYVCLFSDITPLKQVQAQLQHLAHHDPLTGVANRLLKAIAGRIRSQVRHEDTVARLGGDEFGVVVEGVNDPQDVDQFVKKLRTVVEAPLDIEGDRVRPQVSIGMSLLPDDADTPAALVEVADILMYRAKQATCGDRVPGRSSSGCGPGS